MTIPSHINNDDDNDHGLGNRCLVYPHMSNGSLEDVLATRARRKGLSAEMRVRIALGVAHALDYLHTPWLDKPAIIHRDVKVRGGGGYN